MLKLQNKDPLKSTNSVWLVEPKVVIGLAADNDLALEGKGIESLHAEVLVKHEKLGFRLRAKTSQAQINGKAVGDARVYKLEVGDVVKIGDQELQIVDPKKEFKPKVKPNDKKSDSGWALKANNVALSNRIYPLSSEMIVGRSSECDITLAVAHLSRRHAKLIVLDGLLYVKDLGSSNGTYLNKERVTEARVKRGDELCFDTLVFGVMGPSDDTDKTSVRSIGVSSSNESVQINPEKIKQSLKRDALKHRVEQRKQHSAFASDATKPIAETESRKGVLIGLLLLAIIGTGAWLALNAT